MNLKKAYDPYISNGYLIFHNTVYSLCLGMPNRSESWLVLTIFCENLDSFSLIVSIFVVYYTFIISGSLIVFLFRSVMVRRASRLSCSSSSDTTYLSFLCEIFTCWYCWSTYICNLCSLLITTSVIFWFLTLSLLYLCFFMDSTNYGSMSYIYITFFRVRLSIFFLYLFEISWIPVIIAFWIKVFDCD